VLSAVFCYFNLTDVINAAVTVRILIQFGGQIFAVFYIRQKRPDIVLPFRMWLYPVPAIVAACGWIFLIATSSPRVLLASLLVLGSGIVVFFLWSTWQKRRAGSVEP
jgi:amino acid transporter